MIKYVVILYLILGLYLTWWNRDALFNSIKEEWFSVISDIVFFIVSMIINPIFIPGLCLIIKILEGYDKLKKEYF